MLLFTIIGSVDSLSKYYGNIDQSVTYTDIQDFTQGWGNKNGIQCTGESTAYSSIYHTIKCSRMSLPSKDMNAALTTSMMDNETCNSVTGCEWHEAGFLTRSGCSGDVNATALGINDTDQFTVCRSDYLDTDQFTCYIFGCQWSNTTSQGNNIGISSSYSSTTFLYQIGQFATFNVDFDIGVFKYLVVFILVYIPFFMLLFALYMSMPFIN